MSLMLALFLIKLFSNANIIWDKSLIILIINFFVEIPLLFILISFISFIIFVLVGPIRALFSLYYFIGLVVYIDHLESIYSLSCFIVVIFSMLTFYVLIKQDYNSTKDSIGGIFIKLLTMPALILLSLTLTTLISRYIKYNLISFLVLVNPDTYVCTFTTFSLIVPTIILSRILYKTIFYGYISQHSILEEFVLQMSSKCNYHIYNINISLMIVIVLSGFYFLSILFVLVDAGNLVSVSSSESTYSIWSYDEISYPSTTIFENIFKNDIKPDGVSIISSHEALSKGTPIEVETGSGKNNGLRVRINGHEWVRLNNDYFYKLQSYKTILTQNRHKLYAKPFNMDWPYSVSIPEHYLSNEAVLGECSVLADEKRQHLETYVDSFVATLMTHYFGGDRGYAYRPQRHDTDYADNSGRIDFMVAFRDRPVIIIEDKCEKSKYSWWDLISQARNYAYKNDITESTFVTIFRGSKVSFFLYQTDFHSQNGLNLKYAEWDDLLGLYVDRSGIKLMPQHNTVHPQMTIYEAGVKGNGHDQLCVSTILRYMSYFRDVTGLSDYKSYDISPPVHQVINKPVALLAQGNLNKIYIDHNGKFFIRQ